MSDDDDSKFAEDVGGIFRGQMRPDEDLLIVEEIQNHRMRMNMPPLVGPELERALHWAKTNGAAPVAHDPVNHPKHYTQHPSGIECIQITRHMSFNLGNAIKYLWRADLKNGIEDLKKAAWYIEDEIKKRGG